MSTIKSFKHDCGCVFTLADNGYHLTSRCYQHAEEPLSSARMHSPVSPPGANAPGITEPPRAAREGDTGDRVNPGTPVTRCVTLSFTRREAELLAALVELERACAIRDRTDLLRISGGDPHKFTDTIDDLTHVVSGWRKIEKVIKDATAVNPPCQHCSAGLPS